MIKIENPLDLSGYVPYVGATANVDIGSYDFTTTGNSTVNVGYFSTGIFSNESADISINTNDRCLLKEGDAPILDWSSYANFIDNNITTTGNIGAGVGGLAPLAAFHSSVKSSGDAMRWTRDAVGSGHGDYSIQLSSFRWTLKDVYHNKSLTQIYWANQGFGSMSNFIAGKDDDTQTTPVAGIFRAGNADYRVNDTSGANLYLASGKGEGNATASKIYFATPTPGASGSTTQTLASRWFIDSDYGLKSGTDGTAAYDITTAGQGTFGKIRANDKIFFTQTDENEYIDSLNDGYIDIGATTGIRLLQNTAVSGSVTATSFVIGGNTLTTSEWGYLDGQNQALKTTDYPQFAYIGLGTSPNSSYKIYASGEIYAFNGSISSHLATSTYVLSGSAGSGGYGVYVNSPDGYSVLLNGSNSNAIFSHSSGNSAQLGTSSYSIYASGNAYFTADVSALTFTDRTPAWTGTPEEALAAICSIGKTDIGLDSKIDHSTLPVFAQRKITVPIYEEQEIIKGKPEKTQVKIGEEIVDGRDIGATVTMLVESIKALNDKIKVLEQTEVR